MRLQEPGRCRDPAASDGRSRLAFHRPLSRDLPRRRAAAAELSDPTAYLRGRPPRRGPAALPLRLRGDGRVAPIPALLPIAAGRHCQEGVNRVPELMAVVAEDERMRRPRRGKDLAGGVGPMPEKKHENPLPGGPLTPPAAS